MSSCPGATQSTLRLPSAHGLRVPAGRILTRDRSLERRLPESGVSFFSGWILEVWIDWRLSGWRNPWVWHQRVLCHGVSLHYVFGAFSFIACRSAMISIHWALIFAIKQLSSIPCCRWQWSFMELDSIKHANTLQSMQAMRSRRTPHICHERLCSDPESEPSTLGKDTTVCEYVTLYAASILYSQS